MILGESVTITVMINLMEIEGEHDVYGKMFSGMSASHS